MYETNRTGTFICIQSGTEPTKVLPERLYELGVPDNVGLRPRGLFKTLDTDAGPLIAADAIDLRKEIEQHGYAVITWQIRFQETISSDLELTRALFSDNAQLEQYSVVQCGLDPQSPIRLILKTDPALTREEDLEMALMVVRGRFSGLIKTIRLIGPSGAATDYDLPP